MFHNLSQPQSDLLLTILNNAGFDQPTPLQQKVVPVILSGRDVLAETLYAEGRTIAYLLPVLTSPPAKQPEPSVLIAVPGIPQVQKTMLQARRLAGENGIHLNMISLGWDTPIKREVKLLKDNPGIIVGTSVRIIDHIRRNSLELRNLQILIINQENPVNSDEFTRDIQFILSRIRRKPQTVLFAPTLRDTEELEKELSSPIMVKSEDWDTNNQIQGLFEVTDPAHKSDVLLSLFLSGRITRGVIFCRTMAIVKTLEKKLAKENIHSRILSTRSSNHQKEEIIRQFKIGSFPCILTNQISVVPEIEKSEHVIFFNLPVTDESFTEISSSITGRSETRVVTFMTREESGSLLHLQEKNRMKKENLPDNDDVIRGKVESILERIRSNEDPEELNRYRKIIRKNVPLSLRSYVSAYLIKETLGNAVRGDNPFKTVFVSVGRNKRVFPRDLSRLFATTLDISSGDIGSIKVLDNYSFVDVPASRAQEAIDQLDGTDFHGRKIAVNYARKKEEKILK